MGAPPDQPALDIITIPLEALDDQPVGHLDEITRARLDEALRYSLDIVY